MHTLENGIDSNAIVIGVLCLIDGRPHYPGLFKKPEDMPPRALRALDVKTGKTLWETGDLVPTENSLWMDDGVLLSTIIPFSRCMQDPWAVKAGGVITAYSVKTGEKRWQVKKVKNLTPMIIDGVFYSPDAYDLQTSKRIPTAVRFNFGAPGDRSDAKGQVWFTEPHCSRGRCSGIGPFW